MRSINCSHETDNNFLVQEIICYKEHNHDYCTSLCTKYLCIGLGCLSQIVVAMSFSSFALFVFESDFE